MESLFNHLFMLLYIVSAPDKHLRESCLFPARVGIFPLYVLRLKYFSLLCTFTWRVNKYVSSQPRIRYK